VFSAILRTASLSAKRKRGAATSALPERAPSNLQGVLDVFWFWIVVSFFTGGTIGALTMSIIASGANAEKNFNANNRPPR